MAEFDNAGRPLRWVLEEIASGPALLRRYRERGGSRATVEQALAASSEEPAAAMAIDEAAMALGIWIATLMNLLDPGRSRSASGTHPVARMIGRRVGLGVLTLLLVSILVFLATQVLPGNAATAVLQNTATPARVHDPRRRDRSGDRHRSGLLGRTL